MALTAEQKRVIWTTLADRIGTTGPVRFTKEDLRLAATAADAWATANAASYNTALVSNAPAFGADATNAEKALLLAYVALSRAGVL